MTKKNFEARLYGMKAKLNEETRAYEISQAKFDKLVEMDDMADCHFIQSTKIPGYYKVTGPDKRKDIFGFVQIVNGKTKTITTKNTKETKATKAEKSKETTKKTKAVGGQGHKIKGDGYVIKFRNTNDKKETVKTDMTTCAEVKAFLKTVSKKQLEYLHIYDTANNECRKSAWVN